MSGPTSKWTAPESTVIGFPKCTVTPSQPISPSTTPRHVEIGKIFRPAFFCAVLVHRSFSKANKLVDKLQYPHRSISSSATQQSVCECEPLSSIAAPFLVLPFPLARASCNTNAPQRLPASFLPSSGNNSHESPPWHCSWMKVHNFPIKLL